MAASETTSLLRTVHIRIPLKINMVGTYTFRMHADYGLGGYVGVDGASFTDATWGHVELDPVSLTSGEHDFESLVSLQLRPWATGKRSPLMR